MCRLNVFILQNTCQLLGVDMQYEMLSEMKLQLGEITGPGDWALRISEALGAKSYINACGGESFLSQEKFNRSGIELVIRKIPPFEYSCGGYDYISNLSIIDILMFNSIAEIQERLNQFKIDEKEPRTTLNENQIQSVN